MPAVPADLSIACRWILPMTSRGALLENHTLVASGGRIVDVLPSGVAADRYAAAVHLDRSDHLLMPGLVDAWTRLADDVRNDSSTQCVSDSALVGIAAMLQAGTTCFCATGYFPAESARAASAQGMRALIGIPIAETSSRWAKGPSDYLTRALNFRDEFSGHPTIATAFAPLAAPAISDATFARVATLVNELDAGILLSLHESPAEIAECVARHGLRPIERLHALGLLTPALTAANMVHVGPADIALAQRSGVAIVFCPQSNLRSGFGAPPVAAWAQTGLRLSLGTGVADRGAASDLWSELRLLTLLSRLPRTDTGGHEAGLSAWDVLALATRGAAAALGLDAEIGTLETGKWADLCCVDMRIPAMLRTGASAVTRLVFDGGRDTVTDVWVSGRHLLNEGAFTRLDWPALAARIDDPALRPTTGE